MSTTTETSAVLFARYGPRYRIYVTVVALLGTISAIVTTTTVNVALPDIMDSFGIGQDRAQWISTGNLAGTTVGQLLSAWLIDSFGQRKTFVGGLCIFVVALLVAALSPNEVMLTFARVVQGLMAGVLQSLTMFTLFSVFPPEKRGMAMGFFSISVILGPAVGPTLGGILIEHFNWRSVFYMAVPFSVAGILFGSLFMPEREETGRRAQFDWLGFVLLCLTMSSLLTGLSNGTTSELLQQMQRLLAQAGASSDVQSAGALDFLGRMVYAQAYTLAFRDCFLIVTVVFMLALIPAWLMGRKRR